MHAILRPSATALAVLAVLCAAPAAGQFPTTMNYQVMLTDDADQPLVEQAVELVFRLYDVESGGSPGWTETHNTTTNSIGVVSVILGSTNALDFEDFPGLLWLEVEVNGEIMSPRRELTSAPYAFDSYGAHELGGLPASDYATDDELSTPGTINEPGNPVDWTRLKNVPAGFADGDDEAGGAGDGHSLDAYDGDPVDAVWVGANGKVGIGTTSPNTTLHAHRDTLSDCSIQLTNSATGAGTTDGLRITSSAFGSDAYVKNSEVGRLYLGTGDNASELRMWSGGRLDIAYDSSQSGELKIFGTTSESYPLHYSYEDVYGGQFTLNDAAGNAAVLFGADDAGTGGRLQVQRDAVYSTEKGIDLNGNWSSTEEPALRIMGSSRGSYFFMDHTGSSSVQLPNDAICDLEILDEPGVASDIKTSSVALEVGGYTIITQKSITVPSSGYVLVMAGCALRAVKSGGMCDADLGVSDSSSSLPSSQTITWTIPSAAADGTYYVPGSFHTIFPVTSTGTHTYYFLGREYAGNITVWDIQLSLVYFPTAYTSVDPPAPGRGAGVRDEGIEPGPGLSPAEVAAERAEAEAFALARIERELAEIRAQVEAMKEEAN